MPRRRTNFRRKKRYGRKRNYRKKAVTNLGTLIPDRTLVRLKYAVDTFIKVPETAAGGTALGSVVFRCNDMYDPEYANGGHQPMGFDQLGVFYRRFVVTGSRIQVVFMSRNDTQLINPASSLSHCSITVVNQTGGLNANVITDISDIKENNSTTFGSLSGQKTMCTLKKNFSTRKFFGCKDPNDEEDLMGLTLPITGFSGSPRRQAYYQVSAWAQDTSVAGSAARDVPITVMLSYIAQLNTRNPIGGS